MKYLFFDEEHATSYGGYSKICKFAYVLTDEFFNVIESDNLKKYKIALKRNLNLPQMAICLMIYLRSMLLMKRLKR